MIQYLQIPITDHWSENLASFFPTAIRFIGNFYFADYWGLDASAHTYTNDLITNTQTTNYQLIIHVAGLVGHAQSPPTQLRD